MQPSPATQKRVSLLMRIQPFFTLLPGLVLLILFLVSPRDSILPGYGWAMVVVGTAFLAFTTTRNVLVSFVEPVGNMMTTEADLGIIVIALVFTAPTTPLTIYFAYLLAVSVVLFAAKMLVKDTPSAAPRAG